MPTKIVQCKNIFDSKAKAIVCPVNCVGTMGAGLAFAFKNRYPKCFDFYKKECRNGNLEVGRPVYWTNPDAGHDVILFPTKDDWRGKSKLIWIEEGLEYIVVNQESMGFSSVCFPMLGVGCGKLPFKDVKDVMIKHLDTFEGFVSLIVNQ